MNMTDKTDKHDDNYPPPGPARYWPMRWLYKLALMHMRGRRWWNVNSVSRDQFIRIAGERGRVAWLAAERTLSGE